MSQTASNNIDAESFAGQIGVDMDNSASVAALIRRSHAIYKSKEVTDRLTKMSMNEKAYMSDKQRSVNRFF